MVVVQVSLLSILSIRFTWTYALRRPHKTYETFNSIDQIRVGGLAEEYARSAVFQFYRSDSLLKERVGSRAVWELLSILSIRFQVLGRVTQVSTQNLIFQFYRSDSLLLLLLGLSNPPLDFQFYRSDSNDPTARAVAEVSTLSILSIRFQGLRGVAPVPVRGPFQFYRSDSGGGTRRRSEER